MSEWQRSDDLVLVADDRGRFVDASRGITKALGFTRDELLRMAIWDLTPNAGQIDGLILWQEFIRAGAQSGEYRLRTKRGLLKRFRYEAKAGVAPGLHVSELTEVRG